MKTVIKDYIIETLSNELMDIMTVEEIQQITDEDFDRLLSAANLRASNDIRSRLHKHGNTMDSLKTSSVLFQISFACGILAALIWLWSYFT